MRNLFLHRQRRVGYSHRYLSKVKPRQERQRRQNQRQNHSKKDTTHGFLLPPCVILSVGSFADHFSSLRNNNRYASGNGARLRGRITSPSPSTPRFSPKPMRTKGPLPW